jgi:ABC-2 type transport system permease protein
MVGYLALELRRTARTPGFIIFTIAMPLVMYVVFTNIGSVTGEHAAYAAVYAMVSVGGFGAIGALLNYGSSVVTDRATGWLRQLRLMPLSPASVVVGKGVTGVVLALPPVLALCAAAVAINHVSLDPAQWLAIVPLMWLGATPFVLLGLGVGYACSPQTVQPANFVVYFGFSLLGGLWLPVTTFPKALRAIARYTPTHAYADLAWRVVKFNDNPPGLDAAVLAGWSVVFVAFAIWAYRKSAARKDA